MTAGTDVHDLFPKFYAVVLHHWAGSGLRVRWSTPHQSWLRSVDHSRYRRSAWTSEPGMLHGKPDRPDTTEQTTACSVAGTAIGQDETPHFCPRCWREDPQSHFIAPDVYGEPELYCVQVPAYSVVDSSGGAGVLKHWGSPFGCQSVKGTIESSELPRESHIGPAAAYVFGTPLPADEVIDREWCSRCTRAAENVRANSTQTGEDPVHAGHHQLRGPGRGPD